MKVTVVTATENPIDVISFAAGASTRKDDVKYARVKKCIADRHSVHEFADVTLKIEDISRSCLAQLTRHRMASYCVESQRYNKYKLDNDDWYVVPPAIQEDAKKLQAFRGAANFAANEYQKLLDSGVKAEDARFILPEATKTSLYMKINFRALWNLLEQRRSSHAQWEIRQLANEILDALAAYNDQWKQLVDIYYECEQIID